MPTYGSSLIEVYVDVPIDVREARDPKGPYAKARADEIPDFSGISAPYEPPPSPEITIDTNQPLDASIAHLLATLGAAL